MKWLHTAIALIEADYQRSADTHLIALPLPGFARCGIDLYLKDESTHPTGSLKHRTGTGNARLTGPGSRIEGIGRPRVEASFIRTAARTQIQAQLV